MLPTFAANASSAPISAAVALSATPQPKAPDSCGASDYRYLVGKSIEEAHNISGYDYRIVSNASGATNLRRLTVLIDPRSNIIRQVICG
jgi:hypothetical protein